MNNHRKFSADIVAAVDKAKILGIRAGLEPHRFIGLWVVVVEGRIFVRSWGLKERSWYRTFLEEPQGAMTVGDQEYAVKAVRTKSERLKDAVSQAYAEKYNTRASAGYVADLSGPRSRGTTTELVPA